MKEKMNRVGRFVKDHKLPILVFTGFAVGCVVGYRYYYSHKALVPLAPLPGYLKLNLSPENIQWMRDEGGKYVYGDHTTGIFETRLVVHPKDIV